MFGIKQQLFPKHLILFQITVRQTEVFFLYRLFTEKQIQLKVLNYCCLLAVPLHDDSVLVTWIKLWNWIPEFNLLIMPTLLSPCKLILRISCEDGDVTAPLRYANNQWRTVTISPGTSAQPKHEAIHTKSNDITKDLARDKHRLPGSSCVVFTVGAENTTQWS